MDFVGVGSACEACFVGEEVCAGAAVRHCLVCAVPFKECNASLFVECYVDECGV